MRRAQRKYVRCDQNSHGLGASCWTARPFFPPSLSVVPIRQSPVASLISSGLVRLHLMTMLHLPCWVHVAFQKPWEWSGWGQWNGENTPFMLMPYTAEPCSSTECLQRAYVQHITHFHLSFRVAGRKVVAGRRQQLSGRVVILAYLQQILVALWWTDFS